MMRVKIELIVDLDPDLYDVEEETRPSAGNKRRAWVRDRLRMEVEDWASSFHLIEQASAQVFVR